MKNLVWKAGVPFGQSAPVIQGRRVFVTAADGDQLLVLCLDATSGKVLWRGAVRRAHAHKIYQANDPASPTPVVDEGGVYAFFPDFGLVAYTLEGKQAWTQPLGPFKNFYGMAASPILAGDTLILLCDQQTGSYLLALDRKSGKQRWKTARPGATVGWATPAVFRPQGGPPQLITLSSNRVDGYSLATGEPVWWMPVASSGGLGVPLAGGEDIYFSTLAGSEPWMPSFESTLAKYDKDRDGRLSRAEFQDPDMGEHFGWIDADSDDSIHAGEWNAARSLGIGEYGAVAFHPGNAKGKVDPQSVAWRFKKNLPFVPAPLIYKDVFYMVRDGGIVTSLDVRSGKLLKEGRAPEALGEYYASPVAADDKVFLASAAGKVTVLKAGPQWEVASVNDLADEIRATPAFSEGRIYIRTRKTLYCFGAPR